MPISRRDRLASILGHAGILAVLDRLARRAGLLVLNYHRIGSLEGNQLDDGVFSATADEFRAQVRYLRDHFEMPTLDQLATLAEAKFPIRHPTALITFDDGYRDNFETALPVLRELGARAAFFIATGYVRRPRLPWWDHIAQVVKITQLETLALEYPSRLTVDLRLCTRQQAIEQVLRFYKEAIQIDEAEFLERLDAAAGVNVDSEAQGRSLFLSWDQIRRMSAEGMSIGSHTDSHALLTSLSEANQRHELTSSKRFLEAELDRAVDALAYPVGAFNGVTKRLAAEAGYRIGFSYHGRITRPGHTDPFDVRRAPVEFQDSFPLFRARAALQTLIGRSI